MTNSQPPLKDEPSDPRYIEVAKLKLALGDLYLNAADSLPRWAGWLNKRLLWKAHDLYNEGYEILISYEHIKRS